MGASYLGYNKLAAKICSGTFDGCYGLIHSLTFTITSRFAITFRHRHRRRLPLPLPLRFLLLPLFCDRDAEGEENVFLFDLLALQRKLVLPDALSDALCPSFGSPLVPKLGGYRRRRLPSSRRETFDASLGTSNTLGRRPDREGVCIRIPVKAWGRCEFLDISRGAIAGTLNRIDLR